MLSLSCQMEKMFNFASLSKKVQNIIIDSKVAFVT